MTLVDSNILIDIWKNNPEWSAWSSRALAAAADRGAVVVNPIVLAELSPSFDAESDVVRELAKTGLRIVPLPVGSGWPAAQAFKHYKSRGGVRTSPLADFYIGAHALVESWPLLTRDPARYRTYFPKVKLIAPR